jgi:hypothetical protein
MNPNRGVAIVAVPTDRDPARSLDELAAGRIVGSIYTPVAGQYFNVSLKSPSLFVVRVSRRGDRWVADLLDGNRVVTTVPATVQDGLTARLSQPIAVLSTNSQVCYIWDSMRSCI